MTTSQLPRSSSAGALTLLLVLLLVVQGEADSNFKVYPLADDMFEQIYLVDVKSGGHPKQHYLTVSCKAKNVLSISLTPEREFAEAPAFNTYAHSKPKPKMGRGTYTFLNQCDATVAVGTGQFLEVKRGKEGATIFSLSDIELAEHHQQFVVRDESTKWGFGERFQKRFSVTDGSWTIWNRDKPWIIDEGKLGGSDQTYGHHPLYLARERSGKKHHLAYFKNTYGMRIEASKQTDELRYHSLGGPIHFLVFVGEEDPEAVLEAYHDYIGPFHLPPFWSMGYHQCRWGYQTLEVLRKVVEKHNEHDLPLDVMWSDLDYMQEKRIFTINEYTHPAAKLNEMVRTEKIHFVPLLDVGIATRDDPAVKLGTQMDVFFKSPRNRATSYVAEVWPGSVHFVDFLHPNASSFWQQQLQRLYSKLEFGGVWLDMNEPTNFKGGEVVQEPYRIQHNENINTMTINVDLPHYNTRNPTQPLLHREVHAYYGHLAFLPIFDFFEGKKQRPFIISRSTSVGSGYYSGHWTGDNVANWDFLRLSISGNFLFQIFGIPMVGADICGFYKNTTEELCARWIQVGAFYPFARNHNHDQSRSQEGYSFGNVLTDTYRSSLKTRYALLKQMYSIFAAKKGRGSFFRPLTFEFYSD